MRTLKLGIILALVTVILLSMAVTAFAAGNDDVVKAIRDVGIPETYIIQAENYLKTRSLTSVEAEAVISFIQKADEIVKKYGTKDVTKLSDKDRQTLLAHGADAAEALGLNISVRKHHDGTYFVAATDTTGNEVANLTAREVKQTGADYTAMLLGIALLLAAIGFTLVVISRVSKTNAA